MEIPSRARGRVEVSAGLDRRLGRLGEICVSYHQVRHARGDRVERGAAGDSRGLLVSRFVLVQILVPAVRELELPGRAPLRREIRVFLRVGGESLLPLGLAGFALVNSL